MMLFNNMLIVAAKISVCNSNRCSCYKADISCTALTYAIVVSVQIVMTLNFAMMAMTVAVKVMIRLHVVLAIQRCGDFEFQYFFCLTF